MFKGTVELINVVRRKKLISQASGDRKEKKKKNGSVSFPSFFCILQLCRMDLYVLQDCQICVPILVYFLWKAGSLLQNQEGLATFLILEIFCPLNYMWYKKNLPDWWRGSSWLQDAYVGSSGTPLVIFLVGRSWVRFEEKKKETSLVPCDPSMFWFVSYKLWITWHVSRVSVVAS